MVMVAVPPIATLGLDGLKETVSAYATAPIPDRLTATNIVTNKNFDFIYTSIPPHLRIG